jgi:TniQ
MPKPVRSRLFRIPPVAVGTRNCESLCSLIARLADAHVVAPRDIVRYLVPGFDIASRGQLVGQSILGIGWAADAMAAAVTEGMMMSSIHLCTLVRWRGHIHERGLIKPRRAWCAGCFDDQASAGAPVHEPLRWAIWGIDDCPTHGPLVDRCWCCRRQEDYLTSATRPGCCGHCGAWLGSRMAAVQSFAGHAHHEVDDLITFDGIPRDVTAMDSLRTYVQQHFGGVDANFAAAIGFPRQTVIGWLEDGRRPSLPSWIRISRALGQRISSLVSAPEASPPTVSGKRPPAACSGPIRADVGRMHRGLLEMLACDPAPRLRDAHSFTGYGSRTCYDHYPELCKEISARYRVSLSNRAEIRVAAAKAEVHAITAGLAYMGIPVSKHQVEIRMAIPGYMRRPEVKAAMRDEQLKTGQ